SVASCNPSENRVSGSVCPHAVGEAARSPTPCQYGYARRTPWADFRGSHPEVRSDAAPRLEYSGAGKPCGAARGCHGSGSPAVARGEACAARSASRALTRRRVGFPTTQVCSRPNLRRRNCEHYELRSTARIIGTRLDQDQEPRLLEVSARI